MTAMVGVGADHLLAHAMKDDRLVDRVDEAIGTIRAETDILTGLPRLVWKRLKQLSSLAEDVDQLRQIALRGQNAM